MNTALYSGWKRCAEYFQYPGAAITVGISVRTFERERTNQGSLKRDDATEKLVAKYDYNEYNICTYYDLILRCAPMNINFANQDESFIKSKVTQGYYSNATELVRDAVRKMREEEERRARFLAAVKIGEEQLKKGKTVPFSDVLMDEIEETAVNNAAQRKPINNPDALP